MHSAVPQQLPALELSEAVVLHQRALRAAGRSPYTLKGRAIAVRQLIATCDALHIRAVVGRHLRPAVEEYLSGLLRTHKPSVAETRFDQLRAFFSWLVDEEELNEGDHPMRRLRRPVAPLEEVGRITDDELRQLLKVCRGRGFDDVRDTAILQLLVDTGMRVGGLVSMRIEPEWLDLDRQVARIRLKGGRIYTVPFGAKTAHLLGRYLRVRGVHRNAGSPQLWLGARGFLTVSGAGQLLTRRCHQAGLRHLHPHLFRHTLAQWWMDNDGGDSNLMELMGWTSRKQLARYARAGRIQRAHDKYRRLVPSERL